MVCWWGLEMLLVLAVDFWETDDERIRMGRRFGAPMLGLVSNQRFAGVRK